MAATKGTAAGKLYDVIIVGGGPAGLSAALVLARCRRRVLVCDDGQYRNAASRGVHGLLFQDGTAPADLLRRGRREVRGYGAEIRSVRVDDARSTRQGFRVDLADGRRETARKLLLATGIKDRLPEVGGVLPLYGKSVFHCPYCDGWETQGGAVAAYGWGVTGIDYALGLTTWTDDIILFSDGHRIPAAERARLQANGVGMREEKVARLEGTKGKLARVVLETGEAVDRSALFFHLGFEQRSHLAQRLASRVTRRGIVQRDRLGSTGVPGLFVAGDACGDVQFVAVAIAEGAKSAVAINRSLRMEQRG